MTCRSFGRFSAALLLLALAACDRPLDAEDHPVGVAFLFAGAEVASYLERDGAAGLLEVPQGGTRTFTVRVVDGVGNLRPIDGQEYSIRNLGAVIAHQLGISLSGADQIVLQGLAPTETSIRFDLYHANHIEFAVVGVAARVLPAPATAK
jgi:hypothetical protein